MSRIPDRSIDCIICDLPYGVLNRKSEGGKWDSIIPFQPLWAQYERIIKDNGAIVLFCQGMFTARLLMSNPKLWRYNLVWKKGSRTTGFLNANRMPLRNHEDIAIFYKKQPTYNPQKTIGARNHSRGTGANGNTLRNGCYDKYDPHTPADLSGNKFPLSIIDIEKEHDCAKQIHPTQKPVDLIAWLVRTYSNPGDTILDNCSGSGSTAIACIREHRHFIGFETNKEYYDKSIQRIKQEQSQLTLF